MLLVFVYSFYQSLIDKIQMPKDHALKRNRLLVQITFCFTNYNLNKIYSITTVGEILNYFWSLVPD